MIDAHQEVPRMHYFVDESGDPDFLGKKKKDLIKAGLTSPCLMKHILTKQTPSPRSASMGKNKKVLSAARRCNAPHEARGLLSLTQDLPLPYTPHRVSSSLTAVSTFVQVGDYFLVAHASGSMHGAKETCYGK